MGRILSCAAVVALLAANAAAQITPVVLEGDEVPGVGHVTRIYTLAINSHGEWSLEADTDQVDSSLDSVVLSGGFAGTSAVLLQEGQALAAPDGATLKSFDSVTLNDAGDTGYNFLLNPFPATRDSGIYYNGALLLQEGDFSSAPQFSVGTALKNTFELKLNNAGGLLALSAYDDPGLSSTTDQALVRFDDVAGDFTETVIAKEGDVIDDTPVIGFLPGPHHFAFGDDGSAMFIADLDSPEPDNDLCLVVGSTVVARENGLSTFENRRFRNLLRSVDLNASGDYVFRVGLSDPADEDSVVDAIIKNDEVIVLEGETLPGLSLGAGNGPVCLDADGNVLWYGAFQGDSGPTAALFVNEEIIVQEGDLINGVELVDIEDGQHGFALSETGGWVIFRGDLAGGISGVFVLQVNACGADLTDDGAVGAADLNLLLSSFGASCPEAADCFGADLDGNGVVDAADLNLLLSEFGCEN